MMSDNQVRSGNGANFGQGVRSGNEVMSGDQASFGHQRRPIYALCTDLELILGAGPGKLTIRDGHVLQIHSQVRSVH
jgi:hypothetical protein